MSIANNNWFRIFSIFFVVIIIFGRYRTKNLPPTQKELSELFYSFVAFGFYTIFLTFFVLSGNGYGNYGSNINNLQEAQKILEEQGAQIASIKTTLFFFFLTVLISLLPAIYNFAKVLIPKDNKKILNLDGTHKEPILNLSNE